MNVGSGLDLQQRVSEGCLISREDRDREIGSSLYMYL